MDKRRKEWVKEHKKKLEVNDILELRNPQAVVEFIPEIVESMFRD
jgi:hypothetical protein